MHDPCVGTDTPGPGEDVFAIKFSGQQLFIRETLDFLIALRSPRFVNLLMFDWFRGFVVLKWRYFKSTTFLAFKKIPIGNLNNLQNEISTTNEVAQAPLAGAYNHTKKNAKWK